MEETYSQLGDDRYRVTFTSSLESVLPKVLSILNLRSPYLVVSKSLASSPEGKRYLDYLSSTVAGIKDGVGQNSPYEDAIEIAEQFRVTKADSILTLGGGSITDACKLSALLLENVQSPITTESIASLINPMNSTPPAHVKPPTLPMIFIPTTLSAGEYHSHAGCLDRKAGMKKQFNYPGMTPRWVICDAQLASLTPEWVWLSTGLRAIDHACESLCSTIPHDEKYDHFSEEGLTYLLPGLLEVKHSPSLAAYTKCQKGAWNAIKPVIAPTPVQLGASHGIGHKLGGVFSVDHGVTSCVILPAVMKWNKSANGDRQARIVEVFERTGVVSSLRKNGSEVIDAGDLLKRYIQMVGMPGGLIAVDVGEDKWDLLAKESMTDPWVQTNPRKVNGTEDLKEIFVLAR